MATTFTRISLSGSTTDLPLPIAATATPGTLVHTATSGGTNFDELYVWVSNVTASAATLTLEWGGVTDPGNLLTKAVSIPANSPPIPIATGQVMRNGLVIRAFSGTASALNVTGYINRLTVS